MQARLILIAKLPARFLGIGLRAGKVQEALVARCLERDRQGPMNNILVLRGGAIGDFILTLPSIRLLREAYPSSRIEMIGYRHILALAERRTYVDATRCIESAQMAGYFHPRADLDASLAEYFCGFDRIISYLSDPDGTLAGNLRRAGAKRILSASPLIRDTEHASAQLARPLEALQLFLVDPAARVFPNASDQKTASLFINSNEPFFALHPGSGSDKKNWPLESWISLVRILINGGSHVCIVGGESDTERLARLRIALPPTQRLRYLVSVALPALGAILARSQAFIGHDSGISHLAAACGARCLLLFGPTNPNVWAPRNPDVTILQGEPLAHLSVASVVSCLKSKFYAR